MKIIETDGPGYGYPVYQRMDDVIAHTRGVAAEITKIYTNKHQPLILVCRGTSGITIAVTLHLFLLKEGHTNVQIAFLRKPHEIGHHSTGAIDISWACRGPNEDSKLIVVDDIICSGETLSLMIAEMKEYADRVEMVCIPTTNPHKVEHKFRNVLYLIR